MSRSFNSDSISSQRRIAMFTMAWAGTVALFFAFRGWMSDIPERFVPLVLVAIVCAINAYSLNRGGQTQRAAIISISAISCGIFVATYTNGGIQSVAATWVLIIPFLAGLMGSTGVALYGVVLAFFCLSFFLVIDLAYGVTPDLTPPEEQYMQNRFHQFGQLITISICFAYFISKVRNNQNELKQEIEQKRIAEYEAKKASMAKSQFLANMSHEIRTPLNGIISTFSLFHKTELTADQERLLKIADISSSSLLSLINDVLDISKIEAGKLSLDLDSYNLSDLFTSLEELYQYRCQEKSIEFQCERPLKPLWAQADITRIKQILDNLLSNAYKFTEEGSISLRADYEDMEEDWIKLNLTVADTGIGISKQQQEHIFDSFTQADGSTTRNYGGTGLGLTICKELIALMDGSLKLESKANVGSKFSVSLPLLKAQPKNIEKASSVAVGEASEQNTDKTITLLLVDDNDINLEIIKSLLEEYRFSLVIARNGLEAIKIIEQRSDITAVFMDCQMPVMDGYETTKRIRNMEHQQTLPIIAMTANAMQGDREKCIKAGMNGYISKPIDLIALHQELKRFNLIT